MAWSPTGTLLFDEPVSMRIAGSRDAAGIPDAAEHESLESETLRFDWEKERGGF